MSLADVIRGAQKAVSLERGRGVLEYRPYSKQSDFHAAGATHRLRMLSGGNQTGKTVAGAAEVALHATGDYAGWERATGQEWRGRRYSKPLNIWCGSEDFNSNRRGVQRRLLGRIDRGELGLAEWDATRGAWEHPAIPKDRIGTVTMMGNPPDTVKTVTVKHVSGGESLIQFYTYAQGRRSLQADTVDLVWSDEEPPADIYAELIARGSARDGAFFLTFTPLMGRSVVVNQFLDNSDRSVTMLRVDDAPHMTPERIAALKAMYPAHEHRARLYGIPAMGAGAVFPFDFEGMIVNPFQPPLDWIVLDGVDFGYDHPTARVRMLFDPVDETFYVAQEYRVAKLHPDAHAVQWARDFRGRVPVIWPHDGRNTTAIGRSLVDQYQRAGVVMTDANAKLPDGSNSLEGSVLLMHNAMAQGKFRIFRSCPLWIDEATQYRRDAPKSGIGAPKIVPVRDDTLDAARYAFMGLLSGQGIRIAAAFETGRRINPFFGDAMPNPYRDEGSYEYDPR